ncbi:hypothetical protein [Mesorhizobium sp. M0701]|uniref:hypothetical protein n=1 Tax=unclassified Mesorhizobium TaxID=325217 RepID=UPI003335EEF4
MPQLDERGQFIGGVNLACTYDDTAKEQARRFADGRKWSFGAWLRRSNLTIRGTGPRLRSALAPEGDVSAISKSHLRTILPLGLRAVQILKNSILMQARWRGDQTACPVL